MLINLVIPSQDPLAPLSGQNVCLSNIDYLFQARKMELLDYKQIETTGLKHAKTLDTIIRDRVTVLPVRYCWNHSESGYSVDPSCYL